MWWAAASNATVLYGNYPALEADLCQAALGKRKSRGGRAGVGRKQKGDVAGDQISAGQVKESVSRGRARTKRHSRGRGGLRGMCRKDIAVGRNNGKAAEMFGDFLSLSETLESL